MTRPAMTALSANFVFRAAALQLATGIYLASTDPDTWPPGVSRILRDLAAIEAELDKAGEWTVGDLAMAWLDQRTAELRKIRESRS